MQTRCATTKDVTEIATLMQDLRYRALNTTRKLRAYLKNHGQIVMTYDDYRHPYMLVFYRFTEDLSGRQALCDLVAYDNEHRSELAATQLRDFMRHLIETKQCESIMAELHEVPPEHIEQLASLGFLLEFACKKCPGGVFVLTTEAEHIGGIVLERLWAGNDRVLAEA